MRYAFAISALVLSAVMLVLGVGQRTFLAGPSEIVATADAGSDASYAVLPSDIFTAKPGQPNVVVRGEAPFLAIGQADDVEAWSAPFAHLRLSADPKAARLLDSPVPADATGSKLGPLDPRGSDLWRETRSAEGRDAELRLPVALAPDESVLVSAANGSTLPQEISVVWVQDQRTPLAGPFLAAGAILALVGAVLYLLAVDHDRRGLGPRRGRRGPLLGIRGSVSRGVRRRTLRLVAIPAVALVTLGASGCSADYWPELSPRPSESAPPLESKAAPVPLTPAQLDRIIADVARVSGAADESLDAARLAPRFTGDALRQREANYTIRSAVPDYDVVAPRITDTELDYELVQSTQGWPRTVFATVASESPQRKDDSAEPEQPGGSAGGEAAEETSPSLALILTQETPHDNYLVSRVIALRGGITMPEAAPAEEGTALLSDDLQTLVLSPAKTVEAYAALLERGAEGNEAAARFDVADDPLLARTGAAWVKRATERASAEGQSINYSVTVRPGTQPIVSLSTGVGGALVSATLVEERVEDSADGRWKPTAVGSVSALSGLTGKQDRLVREVAHQVLLFVPSGTSGSEIQLLGMTSELVGARN